MTTINFTWKIFCCPEVVVMLHYCNTIASIPILFRRSSQLAFKLLMIDVSHITRFIPEGRKIQILQNIAKNIDV